MCAARIALVAYGGALKQHGAAGAAACASRRHSAISTLQRLAHGSGCACCDALRSRARA
jgi:hypothetical protein